MDTVALKSLLKQVYAEWNDDQIPRLAAALAYYTAFSLAPLLVVVIAVAGLVLGQAHVQEQILVQMRGLLGEQGAGLVGTMLEAALRPREGRFALVLSFVAMMLGASGLVGELQSALNTVWEAQPRPGAGLGGTLQKRFLSFALVLGVGFLLIVTLVVSAALASARGAVVARVGGMAPLFEVVGFGVDFVLTAFMIGLIFKFLPDVRLRARDVAPGAVVTALLFAAGKFAIGFYLGRAAVGSAYGAAGSLAIVLLWVYYSAQILLLGAEFTQVWARRHGAWVEPKADADSTRAIATDERTGAPPLPLPGVAPLPVASPVPRLSRIPAEASPRLRPIYLGGWALGFMTGVVRDRLRLRSHRRPRSGP